MKKPKPVALARRLRFEQTEAEKMLWAKLRNSQLDGVKFRRQEPVSSYVVDFVSFDKKLIIEVDGGQHNDSEMMKKDAERTEWLQGDGFIVLRFWNNDVLQNMEGVLTRIEENLK